MRLRTLFQAIAVLLIPISGIAQTQTGYVKTRGRLKSDGTIVSGIRLPAASVTVRGRNTVTSGKDGSFRVPLNAQDYYLESVQKQGYVLSDPDVLSHRYAYSKSPLVLVMETPSQQTDDKLAAERKIRRTLQRQLQSKEDEIEHLKEEKRITEEEYRARLQAIYSQQEENEQLISDMAERYSKIDYDQLDEFNRRVSALILEGELTKADSLLQTKGRIEDRAESLKRQQELNAKEESELTRRQRHLEKSKALVARELEDLAQDCYSKFEIFKMRHQNDSAAYYIQLRAELDTTVIDWQLSASTFFIETLSDSDRALRFCDLALRRAKSEGEDGMLNLASVYEGLGDVKYYMGDFHSAVDYYEQSLDIRLPRLGENSLLIANLYNNIGNAKGPLAEYSDALKMLRKALEIRLAYYGEDYSEIALIYLNIGSVLARKGEYSEALSYLEKSKAIYIAEFGEDHPQVALVYNNLGSVHISLANYGKALECLEQSLRISQVVFPAIHPRIAAAYNNIGSAYYEQDCFPEALSYLEKALMQQRALYGDEHPEVAVSYNNIATIKMMMGDYAGSLPIYEKALKLFVYFIGDKNPSVATIYTNIAGVNKDLHQYEQAKDYYDKSLGILLECFDGPHLMIANAYNGLTDLYYDMGDYSQAIIFAQKALEVYQAIYGGEHDVTKKQIEKIQSLSMKSR